MGKSNMDLNVFCRRHIRLLGYKEKRSLPFWEAFMMPASYLCLEGAEDGCVARPAMLPSKARNTCSRNIRRGTKKYRKPV